MISELQITKGGANHEPTERVSSPFPNSFFVPSLSFLPLLLLSSFFSSSSFFSFFASFNKSRASSSSLSPFTSFFLQSSFFSPNLPFPFFFSSRVDSSATFTRNYNNSNDNKSWNATRCVHEPRWERWENGEPRGGKKEGGKNPPAARKPS